MKLEEMNPAERNALGALIRLIVRVDGEYSEDEASGLHAAASELGEDAFWELLNESSENDGESAARELARLVDRQEAQEQIYGTLYTIALAGSIEARETALLDWLADTWKLDVVVDEDEDDDDDELDDEDDDELEESEEA